MYEVHLKPSRAKTPMHPLRMITFAPIGKHVMSRSDQIKIKV